MKASHMHHHDAPHHGSQPGMTIDLVCGMSVDPATSKLQHDYQGTTYYFCSAHCLKTFAKHPDSFVNKVEQPDASQTGKGAREITDPVCGMSTEDPDAYQPYIHKGRTYYFCSGHCLTKFKANPESYLGDQKPSEHFSFQEASGEFRDPVCGMVTDDPEAYTKYKHEGKIYYFCSDHCLTKFKADPASYTEGKPPQKPAGKSEKEGLQYTCPMDPEIVQDHPGPCPKCGMALEPMTPVMPASRNEYTCPMHPEVVRPEPGSCPKCGMALEPRTVAVDEEEANPEYEYMKKRFILGAILTLPLVIIAMRTMIPGLGVLDSWAGAKTYEWLELILATPVALWAGWPFYVRAVQSLINKVKLCPDACQVRPDVAK